MPTPFSSTSSLASPMLPRKPTTMYPSASSASYSTLPRMSSRITSTPTSSYADTQPPIVRITTRSYATDGSYATLPRMSSRESMRSSRQQPTRGDIAASPVTMSTSASTSSSQRFAQAIASPDSGYYGGRTSPMVMSTFAPSRHYAAPGKSIFLAVNSAYLGLISLRQHSLSYFFYISGYEIKRCPSLPIHQGLSSERLQPFTVIQYSK